MFFTWTLSIQFFFRSVKFLSNQKHTHTHTCDWCHHTFYQMINLSFEHTHTSLHIDTSIISITINIVGGIDY